MRNPRVIRCESLESRRLLAVTYYVSAVGNDALGGTSQQTAWRSIARVNATDLNAGDRVLFEGGNTFGVGAAAAGPNLIANPGFESALKSWGDTMGASAANAVTSAASPRSGALSLKISGAGVGVRAQDVTPSLRRNQTYTVAAWTRSTAVGAGDRRIGVTFYQSGKQVATFYRGFRGESWAHTQWAFVAPERFDKAIVWVARSGDNSTFCVDDLALRAVPNGIVLDPSDSGTVAAPITIGSYGTGKATIDARDGIGLWGGNVTGVAVMDLRFTGTWNAATGAGNNTGVGIEFVNTRSDNSKLERITMQRCEASGFRWAGVRVGGWSVKSGFRTVHITDSKFFSNGDAGVMIRGEHNRLSTLYSNEKVYIARCLAYGNSGIPGKGGNSGSGIQLTDTLYGTIERCVAHHNGALNNYSGGGPVGIWAFDAKKIVIQHNESYANRTASAKDGGGFDLDGGVSFSALQYNYSHDNDGAGFLLCQFANARAWGSNVVRYNISQNDARRNDYGGITISGSPDGVAIEHNTIYLKPSSGGGASGVRLKAAGSGVHVRFNVIQTTGGAKLVHGDAAARAAQLHGNVYWSSGAAFSIRWNGATFGSLSSWRTASGRERLGAASTGIAADPKLAAAGSAPTLNDASELGSITQYKPLSGSPLIDIASIALASPFGGYAPAAVDFFGVARRGSAWDAGAAERT